MQTLHSGRPRIRELLNAPLLYLASFFNLRAQPRTWETKLLTVFPFLLAILVYGVASYIRRLHDPADLVLPTLPEMLEGIKTYAFRPDRNKHYRLWIDTLQTGKLFAISLAIICIVGIPQGLHMGAFPKQEKMSQSFVLFFNILPAPTVIVILFMIFGVYDGWKIALTVLGVLPAFILETYQHTKAIPPEQRIAALTLGASHLEVTYLVLLPRIFPKVLNTIRLSLKPIILYILLSEMVTASAGLGFRIQLLKRGSNMHIIIPLILYTTLIMFMLDLGIRLVLQMRRFSWVDKE